MLTGKQLDQWKDYALKVYPNEAVALLHEDGTLTLEEGTPTTYALKAKLILDGVYCIVHSHPDGPDYPSQGDMEAQDALDVMFGLSVVKKGEVTDPWYWGEGVKIPHTGRHFRHGPAGTDGKGDCYALIKDYYKEELAITLPEIPRGNEWWRKGGNLYEELYPLNGFRDIPYDQAKKGDLLLFTIPPCEVCNHGAVYLGQGLILHHMDKRLSNIQPLGGWAKFLTKVLRHEEND